jgi:hypothetical protein
MEFYTYVWRDAVGVPFYVGKGKRRRAYDTTSRTTDFKEIHAAGGCSVEIVDWFIHESQAHAHEVELIERYGRREFGGLLVNKTDGGDGATGCTPSDDTRAKIRNAKINLSAEARANLSASLSGRTLSKAHRDKISDANRGREYNSETLSKMSDAMRLAAPRGAFKGVTFDRARGKWSAEIKTADGRKYLGRFCDPETAARVYDAAAVAAFGLGNAYLNFPDEHREAA